MTLPLVKGLYMYYICDISHGDIDNATLLTQRRFPQPKPKEDIQDGRERRL